EDYHRQRAYWMAAGKLRLLVTVGINRAYDHAMIQEHIGNVDGICQQTARVVAQIKNQSLVTGNLFQCIAHLIISFVRNEAVEADVAKIAGESVDFSHCAYRHFGASHLSNFALVAAHEGKLYF